MEILAYILLILILIALFVLCLYDYIKLLKARRDEELRRITLVKTLGDIEETLVSISSALWFEK